MAFKNKILSNAITGQDIKFLQTSIDTKGTFLELESTYHSASLEPPMHYHPYQDEYFEVIEGELTVRIENEIRILRRGEMLGIARNVTHAMWNASKEKTILNWMVKPALHTELLLETIYGLINDGKTNSKGVPSLLQLSLTMKKFTKEFRLTKPAFLIQRTIFLLLAPLAWIVGKRATYKKYVN